MPNARHLLAQAMPRATTLIGLSSMYWVTPEMVSVALDASHDLPEWSTATAMPDRYGILHWRGKLPKITVGQHGEQLPLAGMWWAPDDGRISVNLLVRSEDAAAAASPLAVPDESTPPMGPAQFFSLPVFGPAVPEIDPKSPIGFPEMVGVAAFVGATWILMQQESVSRQREFPPSRRDMEIAARFGGSHPLVTSVSLRPMRTQSAPRDAVGVDEPKRHLTVRHVVRGHWRQQYYSSDESHRPRWIESYIKGPEGAPLHLTEKVLVWRR